MTRKLIDDRRDGELTVKEAAQQFNYVYAHLLRLVARGVIPARQTGTTRKRWFIKTEDMQGYAHRTSGRVSTVRRIAALEARVAELERLQYAAPMKAEQVQK
ncbi:MAG: hypothetical protein K2W95_00910 [Candidatus Obscuribacterales bacterium]|nr:hypothetical protein [Candidatus Obscuribacterales bacterium]